MTNKPGLPSSFLRFGSASRFLPKPHGLSREGAYRWVAAKHLLIIFIGMVALALVLGYRYDEANRLA